ncbi:TPA: hypothetical protein SB301_001831 [Campylobacter coli]|nr:hypothetical protein [Campylobacter coli]
MPEQTANSELLQNIITSAKENPPVTLNDVLSMVTDQMSQVVNMDDETKDMFKDLFLRMNSQIIEEN